MTEVGRTERDFVSEPIVVHPPSEIDPLTAPQLDAALAACDPAGDTRVAFGDVTFCDSSGLRVLVTHSLRHLDAGGTFSLTDVLPAVRRVFEITGTVDTLGIGPPPE